MRNHTNINGRDSFGKKCLDGRTVLKWILDNYGVKVWTGLDWLRVGLYGEII
jgi:hypothetical protein